jgi:hypothetical protein
MRSAMLALGLTLALPAAAHAEEADAGIRMAARELAVSGAEAYDKQDYATALDRFRRAESLYKAPSIAVMVARCLSRVGRVVEAVDKYEETLRTPLDAAAPEAFQRAVADAKAEVEGARARVARLELRLPADAASGAEVRLDGRLLPPALLGVEMPVDPGTHHVLAQARGRSPAAYDLSLAEGAHQALEITFAPAGAPASRSAAPAPIQDTKRAGSPALAIALLSGGGIALAAGTVTGIAALSYKSTLDDNCNPGCPSSMSSNLDAFRLDRTLSYVGFGVGLAALGAGTYLLLHRSAAGTEMGAVVLPGGAALRGRF